MRREAPLEAWAVRYARARGVVVAKLTALDGVPDRIFFLPGGRPLLVEFKRHRAGSRGLQVETQKWYEEALRSSGYETARCDTKERFLELWAAGTSKTKK